MLGIIAAHHALKLREFTHHAGGQIRLGQERGAASMRRVSPHQRRNLARQHFDAAYPLTLAAELGVEGDVVQRRDTIRQPRLTIQIPEMPRIGKARPQHALIARDDRSATILRLDIGGKGEPGSGRPIRIAQREIALIDAHRDLHHLGGQIHIRIVDPAEQAHRPLHQPCHFIEQARIIDNRGPLLGGQRIHPRLHQRATLGGIHDHMARPQFFRPLRHRGDGEMAVAEEAMAFGDVGGMQPMRRVIAIAQVERHHRAIENGGDPAQRAHPGEGRGAAPAHRFRPGEAADQPRHRAGDQFGGGGSGDNAVQHPEIAFLSQLLLGGTMLAQKARQCLLRCAGARAAFGDAGFRHRGIQLHRNRDAACAIEARHIARLQGSNGLAEQAGEILRALGLHARGDFLAEEFQEKFGHVSFPRPLAKPSPLGVPWLRSLHHPKSAGVFL